MEVHHHSHQPKKIKEYLTEFLMLFVAVTMGFFAENLREHKVVEHRMEENYASLLEDLHQDQVKIQRLFSNSDSTEVNLVKLKYLLYRYHKNEIDWPQLKKGYNELGTLPSYATLFINNTTFKNMQSSGLLSYISNKELKSKLSYYYEVVFKRLEDNNKLFDQAGVAFFKEEIPHKRNIEIGRFRKDLLKDYPEQFSDNDKYAEYLLGLPIAKDILTSDRLIYAVDSYSGRYYDYHGILREIADKNKELAELIKSSAE